MRTIFVIVLFSIYSVTSKAQELPLRANTLIYLFIGQSNCAGQGRPALPSDQKKHPRVWMLTKDLQITPAIEPVGFGSEYPATGPALAFGKLAAEKNPSKNIILVPAAVSNTSLERWLKGAAPVDIPFWGRKVRLYDEAISRVLKARGLTGGTIAGVIWHQGEGDCFLASWATTYGSRLRSLCVNLREDLGNQNLPIVVGEIPRFLNPRFLYRELVVAQTRDLTVDSSDIYLPSVMFVESGRITPNQHEGSDPIHFNAEGQHLMAQRYFEAFFPKQATAESWQHYE